MKRIVVLLVAACGGPPATPKPPTDQPGRAERLQLGSLEAYALADGHLVVPNDGKLLGVGHPTTETGDLLAAAGLPRDVIRLDIQCLLVKTADRVILFDAGAGSFIPTAGELPQSLAAANVSPAAVTDIFISHAHSDHVGGLVAKDALAFPAATVHMSAPEWAAFQAEGEVDADSKRFVAALASRVQPFEPGAQVLPEVKAVATPGHTAGHSSYEIAGLFVLGDLAHHRVISVQRPAWPLGVDADPPAAIAIRKQTLARLAADHTRVFSGHFPFPGIGQVAADGQGLVWKAEVR